MIQLNPTHDPARRSWVPSANEPGADFPIQNLPYCVFSHRDSARRVGVGIGDQILDLTAVEAAGKFRPDPDRMILADGVLNPLMAMPQGTWSGIRAAIAGLLDATKGDTALPLIPQNAAQLHLPFFVRSFTDFYASREHATNVGSMFRDPENALMPNWLHIPIGYNGRASTVVVSGTPVHRPHGQLKGPDEDVPRSGPSDKLDIELELGAVVGTPNPMGRPVSVAQAYDNIFGYVLLNDWSARDIQVWEYQPLGPFQSKAFATSISPWVVTREALAPFRVPTPEREKPLLPYLQEDAPNNFDLHLEVALAAGDGAAHTISRTNYRHMYYSSAQQLAHHTVSGCAMETGDLIGSGTISGPSPDSLGSLLEMTWNGQRPLDLDGTARTFLEDGDIVTLSGWCAGDYRVGFGTCQGQILPAVDLFP